MTNKIRKTVRISLPLVVAAQIMATTPAIAQDAEAFYAGKTLTLMHVTGPGGNMDLAALLAIDYMTRCLPSGTNIVLEHRPGAGGIVGTNYGYNAAPRDGTFFFMPTPSLVPLQFARPDQALYDSSQLQPLGRVLDSPRVFIARADSGINTFEDLKSVPATHSTMPPGSTAWTVAAATNEIVGTQLDIVPGYNGGGPMVVALEQGEVQTTTAESGNLLANRWHLVENGTINVLAQTGLEPAPGLEDVPLWIDFVPVDHPMRGVVEVLAAGGDMGLALFMPPEVPQDRVDYMRGVLECAMTNPELLAEVRERNIPFPGWQDWQFVAGHVESALGQPEPVQEWFRASVAQAN